MTRHIVGASDTYVKGPSIASDTEAELKRLGKELQRKREDAGFEQAEAAEKAGVSRVSLSRYENGRQRPPHDVIVKLQTLYGGAGQMRVREPAPRIGYDPRGTSDDAWSPNPALRGQIPERAYEVAIGYCRRLAAAGIDREQIDEAERLMIDRRFAKANKREGRELSEDDWVLLVDDAFDAIREVLSWKGVKV